MAEKKTLKDIQHDIDKWVQNHGGYWPPLSMLSAVIEEIGELAREINCLEGFKPKKSTEKNKKDLGEELADLIFSIICLANYYEIDLNEKIKNIFKKYSKRDSNRFI
ncbi:MAG: nucleotide pyrophosphohydrolase [Promethearchaeota archaeon]